MKNVRWMALGGLVLAASLATVACTKKEEAPAEAPAETAPAPEAPAPSTTAAAPATAPAAATGATK